MSVLHNPGSRIPESPGSLGDSDLVEPSLATPNHAKLTRMSRAVGARVLKPSLVDYSDQGAGASNEVASFKFPHVEVNDLPY